MMTVSNLSQVHLGVKGLVFSETGAPQVGWWEDPGSPLSG